MNFRDIELLSAYLDGQLSPPDAARLEDRLKTDAALQDVIDDLRLSRDVLRSLPARKAPRKFTLTPKMAGIKPPEPRAYPAFRLATVLAGLLFVASLGLNSLAHAALSHVALQAEPAYGFGSGETGGSPPAAAPLMPGAPQSFAAVLPTETLTAAQDKSQALTAPTAEFATESIPPAGGAAPRNALPVNPPSLNSAVKRELPVPVPLAWQIGLVAMALIFGIAAGLVRLTSEREFRKRFQMDVKSTQPKDSSKK